MARETEAQLVWNRRDTLVLALLTIAGGVLRCVRLRHPGAFAGDESFYVEDACWYIRIAGDLCTSTAEVNIEHPPLGKWLIAWGMALFGEDHLGSRLVPVILGTLTIPLLYLLARRLLRSRLAATVVAGLLTVDFMHFALSRVAMLDVPLVFFGVISLLCLAHDRDRPEDSYPWWRYGAGAAAGAAIATKWTGITYLATVAFLAIAWDVLRRRTAGERHPVLRAAADRGPGWLVAFAAVPLVVYALTFIGRIDGALLAAPWDEGSWPAAFWERQLETFRFHAEHIWAHRLASEPWSWPLAKRGFPMATLNRPGVVRTVVAAGNPVIWTIAVLAVGYVAYRWLKRPGRRSSEGFILGAFAFTYLPWFVYAYAPWLFFTWGRVATFIFYFVPILPVVYLAFGYTARDLVRRSAGRMAVAAVCLFALGAFAFYYPVIAYQRLDPAAFQARMFAFDDCDPPDHAPLVFIRSSTVGRSTFFRKEEADVAGSLPPEGWCWL